MNIEVILIEKIDILWETSGNYYGLSFIVIEAVFIFEILDSIFL